MDDVPFMNKYSIRNNIEQNNCDFYLDSQQSYK